MRKSRLAIRLVGLSFLAASGSASDAFALGSLGFDSEGFFENSPYRSNSSTWFFVDPSLEAEGHYVEGVLNLRGYAFVNDFTSSFTVDSGDTYLATSKQLSTIQQASLGRRKYTWSDADEFWALGMWQPRFLWDVFRPKTEGLTGAFYTYSTKQWKFLAFASPMTIPDRSYPVVAQNGKLVAGSNDLLPPYQEMTLLNRKVGINYSLAMPPMSDLLLKPGVGLSVRYDENDGRYARISTGLLPSNQLDLSAELALHPTTAMLNATIHPRNYYHQMTTLEVGRSGEDIAGWASITRESPLSPDGPSNWISQPMGPSWIAAIGGSAHLGDKRWLVSAGGLWIDEDAPTPTDEEAALHLPPRFNFSRASRFSAQWTGSERVVPGVTWTHDFQFPGNLLSLDTEWMPKWARGWQFSVGADFFSSASPDGFIGQYQGDDRFRLGVRYAL